MTNQALLSSISGLLLIAAPAFGQEYRYISFDVSCDTVATSCPAGLSPGSAARQTSARGINARGDIVGFYVDTAGVQHGFVLEHGTFTTIDFPVSGVRGTVANGSTRKARSSDNTFCRLTPTFPQIRRSIARIIFHPTTPIPRASRGFIIVMAFTQR